MGERSVNVDLRGGRRIAFSATATEAAKLLDWFRSPKGVRHVARGRDVHGNPWVNVFASDGVDAIHVQDPERDV